MYMIFGCNMLILSPRIVFNILFGLMYDICDPLRPRIFAFALVIVNPTISG